MAELGPDLANPVKDAVLLMAAEGDTEENFAPVRAYYKALLDCLGWKDARALYTPAGTWPSGISRPIRSSWRPPGNWARRCDRPAVVLTLTRTGAGASLCFRVRGDIMQPSKPNAVGNHDAAAGSAFTTDSRAERAAKIQKGGIQHESARFALCLSLSLCLGLPLPALAFASPSLMCRRPPLL